MKFTVPMVRKVEGENPWVTYIKATVFEKNNCTDTVVIGERGSGKSWATLKMCHDIDPDFDLNESWFFKASKFMRDVDKFYHPGYKRGKIWVIDEAGVDLYNLDFMNELNKGMSLFLQTARHRNYIFFATVPYFSFISKAVRKLMTSSFLAGGVVEGTKTLIYPRILQWNDKVGDWYNKRIQVEMPDQSRVKCNDIRLPMAPIKLIREYEKMKEEFTSALNRNIADRLKFYEEQKQKKFMSRLVGDREEVMLKMLKDGLTVKEMAEKECITPKAIFERLKVLKGMGFNFTILRDPKQRNKITGYRVNDPRDRISPEP